MLRLTLPARLSAHSDSARAAETAAATALTRDAEGVAEQRLRRQRTESYHDPWLQTRQLGCQPHAAGCLLRRIGTLVQGDLAAQIVLEVPGCSPINTIRASSAPAQRQPSCWRPCLTLAWRAALRDSPRR